MRALCLRKEESWRRHPSGGRRSVAAWPHSRKGASECTHFSRSYTWSNGQWKGIGCCAELTPGMRQSFIGFQKRSHLEHDHKRRTNGHIIAGMQQQSDAGRWMHHGGRARRRCSYQHIIFGIMTFRLSALPSAIALCTL